MRRKFNRKRTLILLDKEYMIVHDRHYKHAPRNGIPAGGGEWMDCFFRMEAIRGAMNALRNGGTPKQAFKDGCIVSEIAIQLWNKHREWQVQVHEEL